MNVKRKPGGVRWLDERSGIRNRQPPPACPGLRGRRAGVPGRRMRPARRCGRDDGEDGARRRPAQDRVHRRRGMDPGYVALRCARTSFGMTKRRRGRRLRHSLAPAAKRATSFRGRAAEPGIQNCDPGGRARRSCPPLRRQRRCFPRSAARPRDDENRGRCGALPFGAAVASSHNSTILPACRVTRRSMRAARSWLWVAMRAAKPEWRTSASMASKT